MEANKEGKCTLKEQILFLQVLEKFGINWKQISELIPARTYKQIRLTHKNFITN